MILNISFALFIGGLVGIVGHVRKKGKIIKPRKTKKFIYLGFLEEVLMGALTAVVLVISADTDSLLRIVLLSIMAGIGGDALLNGLEFFRTDQNQADRTIEK
jgi:RsiW-degrading membrane proteinase PrsW (M82 family)